MRLSEFDYDLPERLIATHPLAERTASRLLCLNRASGTVEHGHFSQLPEKLRAGDLLVLNNTRVLPSRIYARKPTGAKVEILIERVRSARTALAQVGSNRTPKVGAQLICPGDVTATVIGREDAFFVLEFAADVVELLHRCGEMPLPPYIDRPVEAEDAERYQTVYAEQAGAVAAPTAGLHFDEPLLQELRTLGVEIAHVTLHVGAGTFVPVRVEEVEEHRMHAEYLDVPPTVCAQIATTRERGGRVIAVGTTSMRALESAAGGGELRPMQGETRLFILPGYRFRVCDALITNFHLPRSTLLMLISAFAGIDHVRNAYAQAIAEEYRFFSYGDAMFIHGAPA